MSRIRTWEESVPRFPLFFLFALISVLAGCTKTEENGTVIARVNDNVLTLEEIHAHSDPSRPLSPSEVQQYANRWVINELLYQEAQQRGYDESEQIRMKVEDAKKQLTIADLLEKEVYAVTENSIRQNEIASYFQSHTSEFTLQENIARLSVAVFSEIDPANQFRTAALGETGWSAAVDQFGADAAKGLISYADSTFYSQSSLYPPELWKVAGALGMLEVSFPVKTSVGFVVLRSLGQFKAGTNAPLAYVEPQIRSRLTMEQRQQRYQQYIQSLRAKHAVQMTVAAQDSLSGER
jgi:hypothetical protein